MQKTSIPLERTKSHLQVKGRDLDVEEGVLRDKGVQPVLGGNRRGSDSLYAAYFSNDEAIAERFVINQINQQLELDEERAMKKRLFCCCAFTTVFLAIIGVLVVLYMHYCV